MTYNKLTALIALVLLIPFNFANADIITFGPAQNITSIADVSTQGTLVAGFNGGASTVTSLTAGAFSSTTLSGATATAGNLGAAATGSLGLDTLLDEASVSTTAGVLSPNVTLIAGRDYEYQIFYSDLRRGNASRQMQFSSFDTLSNFGNTVELQANPGGGSFGQFAIGTVTNYSGAGNPTVIFTTFGLASFTTPHITAWQVRDVTAVPEPTSAGLGLTFVVIGLVRRRRRMAFV